MKLKTLKQTCECCNIEFETCLDYCFPCFVKKHKAIIFPQKKGWQKVKVETWAFLFTVPLYALIFRYFGLDVLLIFIVGLVYGTFLDFLINLCDRKF